MSSSSRLICWLTVDWVRWTRSLARVKPPASTTDTKLRKSSRSSMEVIYSFFHWMPSYYLIFKYQGERLHREAKENSHVSRQLVGRAFGRGTTPPLQLA